MNEAMETLTIKEILDVTDGRISFPLRKNKVIKSISIDSRTVKRGNLFIALKGERFDGHNFVPDAF